MEVPSAVREKLFEQERAFVWYPEASLASLPRSELDGVEVTQVDLRNIFIGKGLLKLILSFLACSNLKMEAQKKRHESVQGLIHHTVHETIEPVIICYSLISTSKSFNTKKVNRIIRRERKNSKSFTQKIDWCSGSVSMIKYVTYFSEPISVSALLQNVDHVLALSEEVL
ncbi:hypothetical protein VNO80_11661 [Phaseolus coccineus]|uniref:Uncharacterized protein n=1 Tax=Phaseolus coccineus TaxID=3886 RepID=A0AAN9RFP8_PHACN